jgi:DNA-binding MarR family transcriptional regulator
MVSSPRTGRSLVAGCLATMLGGTIVVVNNNLPYTLPGAASVQVFERKHVPRNTVRPAAGIPARKRGSANGPSRRAEIDDEIGLDALVGHAGYAVRRFQLWIFQDFIRTLAEVDIKPTQYSVMTVIGANSGLSQMAVAKRLGIERARLVHLLDSLEARKLVKRVPSATDRRSHELHLTAHGQDSLCEFKRLAAEHERHVAAKIGKQNRERLLKILACFT